jgi:ribosomal protein S12 methylthiotransferase accessory factor
LILGAPADDPLGLLLGKAFGRARLVPDLTAGDLQGVDLAVGISAGSDPQLLSDLARRAQAAAVPLICLRLFQDEALLGPLALPGRAGCHTCASERMAGASAGRGQSLEARPADQNAQVAGSVLVREVRAIIRRGVESSQLLDHVLVVDRETEDESLHRVIPLSRCVVCGGAAAFPRTARKPCRISSDDPPEELLEALEGWVDLRTGVISGVFLEPPIEPVKGLPITAIAAPPHIMNSDRSLRRLPLGWGKGLSVSGALLSAVGEAIERYSASLPEPGRIVWKLPDELEGEYLDPRMPALHTDEQYGREDFPFSRFDPDFRHPWVAGKWLSSERTVWVPAVFAFLSMAVRKEHVIGQGTSSGLAAWTDPEEAARRATLELVERDACLTAWLTATPGQRILIDDSFDPALRRVLEGVECLGATVEVYLLRTSVCGVTVLCLGLGDGEHYPGATIGLGADLDVRSALRQAVLELGQTGPYLQRMMRSGALPVPEDASQVREMLQHAAYYFPRERARAFDRLRSQHSPLELGDLAEGPEDRSLAECAEQLSAAGVRIALVDVTSADVATGPFTVVRAISPDLQPISYGYGLQSQPVERIRTLGLAAEIPPIQPIW